MVYQFRAEGEGSWSGGALLLTKTQPRLTATQRKEVALAALAGACVTDLAQAYGVSRKCVYQQKKIALAAIDEACMAATEPPEKKILFEIKVTKAMLAQLILSLVLCGWSSYRAVQRILEDVFDSHLSVGTIVSVVELASQKAAHINDDCDLRAIPIACHDEFSHHDTPIFVVVEPCSRYCLLLTKGVTCSELAWITTLKPLVKKGYSPSYVVADGGNPLRSGFTDVFPKTPCYDDVFHLSREFGRCMLIFRKDEQHCRSDLRALEERILRYDISPEDCPDTFRDVEAVKRRLDFDMDAIDKLRQGLGRTIHKALSLSKTYTFAEREAFYDKTLDSLKQLQLGHAAMRYKASPLYSLLCSQKENLLGLFQHPHGMDMVRVRARSMVENFNFSLRQQLQGQSNLEQKHLDLHRFYLNHRRFLASHSPERKSSSPAELLDHKKHPHWLELLGYERYRRSVT